CGAGNFSLDDLQPGCTRAATVRLRSPLSSREQSSSPGNAGPSLCPPCRMRWPGGPPGLEGNSEGNKHGLFCQTQLFKNDRQYENNDDAADSETQDPG